MAKTKKRKDRSEMWPQVNELRFGARGLRVRPPLFQAPKEELRLDLLETLLLERRKEKMPEADALEVGRALTAIQILREIKIKPSSREERIAFWAFKLALHCDRAGIGLMPSLNRSRKGQSEGGRARAEKEGVPAEKSTQWRQEASRLIAAGKSQSQAADQIAKSEKRFKRSAIIKHIKGIKR